MVCLRILSYWRGLSQCKQLEQNLCVKRKILFYSFCLSCIGDAPLYLFEPWRGYSLCFTQNLGQESWGFGNRGPLVFNRFLSRWQRKKKRVSCRSRCDFFAVVVLSSRSVFSLGRVFVFVLNVIQFLWPKKKKRNSVSYFFFYIKCFLNSRSLGEVGPDTMKDTTRPKSFFLFDKKKSVFWKNSFIKS